MMVADGDKADLLASLSIDRQAVPQRRRIWPWVVVCGLVIACVATGVVGYQMYASAAPPIVRIATAQSGNGGGVPPSTVLNASGYVVARRSATVSSKVTGRVAELLVEEGMQVQKGQVVARLDDVNARQSFQVTMAELNAAKSRVAEVEARLRESKLSYERNTSLAAQMWISAAALDTARSNYESVVAQLESQRRSVAISERVLDQQRQGIEDLALRAPFAGIVVAKSAQLGEIISPVSAGSGFTRTGICTIVDMSSLDIEVDVNEAFLYRVRIGQPVDAVLDAYPDWKMAARVSAIIPTADRQKATVKVRIAFDKLDPRILPDMGIKVALRDDDPAANQQTPAPAVRIPLAALRQNGPNRYVFVVVDQVTRQRAVHVGHSTATEAFVNAGLQPGEQYVADANPQIQADMRVRREQGSGLRATETSTRRSE